MQDSAYEVECLSISNENEPNFSETSSHSSQDTSCDVLFEGDDVSAASTSHTMSQVQRYNQRQRSFGSAGGSVSKSYKGPNKARNGELSDALSTRTSLSWLLYSVFHSIFFGESPAQEDAEGTFCGYSIATCAWYHA